MRMDYLQQEIGEWGNQTFPHGTAMSACEHLIDEALELRSEIVRLSTPAGDKAEAGAECADIGILLFQVCHRLGICLRLEINKKMEINRKRKWGQSDARGVVRHVEHDAPEHKPENDIGPADPACPAVLVKEYSPAVAKHA